MSEPGKFSSRRDDQVSDALPPGLKYSISQITSCRTPLETDLQAWQEAGIPAIGLWRRKLDDFETDEAVELIRESGLTVSSVSFAGGFTGSTGMNYREAMNDATEAVFLAAAVGAGTVVVAPGARGRLYTPKHEKKVIVQAMRELALMADQCGVELAVLPKARPYAGRWTGLHSLEEAAHLIDIVDRPNVRMALNTFQLVRSPDDVERLPAFLPYVGLVQFSDAPRNPSSEYDQLLPGQGVLPLAETMQVLADECFEGFVELQVWSDRLWERDLRGILRASRKHVERILPAGPKSSLVLPGPQFVPPFIGMN